MLEPCPGECGRLVPLGTCCPMCEDAIHLDWYDGYIPEPKRLGSVDDDEWQEDYGDMDGLNGMAA